MLADGARVATVIKNVVQVFLIGVGLVEPSDAKRLVLPRALGREPA